MPTNRRRIARIRRGHIHPGEPDKWKDFSCLYDVGGTGPLLGFMSDSPEEAAEYWDDQGDRLVAEWIADYPGTRPNGWWCFDPVAVALPEIPITRHLEDFARYESQLRSCSTLTNGRFLAGPYYQDVAAFLAEHGVLTPEERSALGL